MIDLTIGIAIWVVSLIWVAVIPLVFVVAGLYLFGYYVQGIFQNMIADIYKTIYQ